MRNFKQRLKGNSVLEIVVEKCLYCQKICEALVVYKLERYLIIYP